MASLLFFLEIFGGYRISLYLCKQLTNYYSILMVSEDNTFLPQDRSYRSLKCFQKAECIYDVTHNTH